jgi:hypothetical protein
MLIDQPSPQHLGLIERDIRRRCALHQAGQQERCRRDAAFHCAASLDGFLF